MALGGRRRRSYQQLEKCRSQYQLMLCFRLGLLVTGLSGLGIMMLLVASFLNTSGYRGIDASPWEPRIANYKYSDVNSLGGRESEDGQVQAEGKSLMMEEGNLSLVSRVAFGSCTSRRTIDQPIWRRGIIPSSPQAWIWAGDLAYMDWPEANCKENPDHSQCNCTRDWLHHNRLTCLASDILHAKEKLELQLQNPDYKDFIRYMCSGSDLLSSGTWDLALCEKPIFGTWDDHDYNWQDGDKRMPSKEQQKQLFLDAFGVPASSPRRAKDRGLYWKHILNEGVEGKEIDVLLLDERFHRDNKPCEVRREFCEKVAIPDPKKYKNTWCKDFMFGGADGRGSCCKKDEQIWRGWCRVNGQSYDLWEAACDPRSQSYGYSGLEIDPNSGAPYEPSDKMEGEGILCEVLGVTQRDWLQDQLYSSQAPLKLVVSGSPVFNNPNDFVCAKALKWRSAVNCTCYDDYDCFRPAQINLLHTMAHAPGCVVVLTGDFHFSDIKPGNRVYREAHEYYDLPRAVHQVMASGLTSDTAQKLPCDGYRVDKAGLRPGGECAFVSGPAFGMIEVDWDAPGKLVKLQVRNEVGEIRLESVLRMDTCSPVKLR